MQRPVFIQMITMKGSERHWLYALDNTGRIWTMAPNKDRATGLVEYIWKLHKSVFIDEATGEECYDEYEFKAEDLNV
jgi:hypothetical protein